MATSSSSSSSSSSSVSFNVAKAIGYNGTQHYQSQYQQFQHQRQQYQRQQQQQSASQRKPAKPVVNKSEASRYSNTIYKQQQQQEGACDESKSDDDNLIKMIQGLSPEQKKGLFVNLQQVPAGAAAVCIPCPANTKNVLPCFNVVCTGTCAYGPKCTFLHDPRAQLPKNARKQAEFLLQSHLHTYRPHTSKHCVTKIAIEDEVRLHASECKEDKDSDSTDQQLRTNVTMKSFKRDDIFDFPTMPMQFREPNSKYYDPTQEQLPIHQREMSMWYHMLANVNEKCSQSLTKTLSKSRLPIFEKLMSTV